MKNISRREFFRVSALAAAGVVVTACAQAVPTPTTAPKAAPPTAVPPTAVPAVKATTAPAAQPTVAPTTAPAAAAQPTVAPAAKVAGKYQEAPMLAELVKAGKLPPVAERLPAEPLVLTPVEAVGKYCDKWVFAQIGDTLGDLAVHGVGENFTRWTRDCSGFRNCMLTAYEWNDTATELTMHMRKGVKWSDGKPVTFNDWIFYWEDMVMDKDVKLAAQSGYVVDGKPMVLEKIDDYNVKVKFVKPNPLFLQFRSVGTNGSSYVHMPPAHYMKTLHPKYTPGADVKVLLQKFANYYADVNRPSFGPWVLKEIRLGVGATLERNPYYFKVDPEGKQLPYFDRTEVRIVQQASNIQPLIINGELDYQFRNTGAAQDYSLLIENQKKGDYTVDFWGAGNCAVAGMLFYMNYKDKKFAQLLWKQKFRQAISVAVNRKRINEIVYFGTGKIRQFAMVPSGAEFASPRGQQILKAWENDWAQFDPELCKKMLDEIGIKDVNKDGWREYEDGAPLELIVDVDVSAPNDTKYMQLVKEDWEKVGLKTVLNVIDGTLLSNRALDGSSGLRARGGAASGLLIAAGHWTPVSNSNWVTLGAAYGLYFVSGGTQGEKPPEGSFIEKLQQRYAAAIVEPNEAKRTELLLDGYELCVKEGPTCLGFVGLTDVAVIRKNNMRNMTKRGETVESWTYVQPNTTDPEQWFKV